MVSFATQRCVSKNTVKSEKLQKNSLYNHRVIIAIMRGTKLGSSDEAIQENGRDL